MQKSKKRKFILFSYFIIFLPLIYLAFLLVSNSIGNLNDNVDEGGSSPSIYRIEGLKSDLNIFGDFQCKVNAELITLYQKKYSIFNIRLGNEFIIKNLEVDLFKNNKPKFVNTTMKDKTSNNSDEAEISNYISDLLPTKALCTNGKISNLCIRIHSASKIEKIIKAKEGKFNLVDNTIILRDAILHLKDFDRIIFSKIAKINLIDFTINISESYYTVGKEKILKDKVKTIKL